MLIHDSEVAGIFDTYADALSEGYQRSKLDPILVKQIQAIEQAHFHSSVSAETNALLGMHRCEFQLYLAPQGWISRDFQSRRLDVQRPGKSSLT